MDPQPLANLERVSNRFIDCKSLLDATHNSFHIIQQWNEAHSDDELTQTTLNNIRSEVTRFHDSVKQSVTAAQEGYVFAIRAIGFCDVLLDAQAPTEEEIQRCIDELLVATSKAHGEAEKMCKMFSGNRARFMELTKEAKIQEILEPTKAEIQKITSEQDQHNLDKAVAAHRAEFYGRAAIGTVAFNVVTSLTVVAAGMAALPVVIGLSLTAPIVALGASVFKERNQGAAAERERESLECGRALKKLRGVCPPLDQLVGQLDANSKIWLKMETTLYGLKHGPEDLKPERITSFRAKSLKKRWVRLRRDFLCYKVEASLLQDISIVKPCLQITGPGPAEETALTKTG